MRERPSLRGFRGEEHETLIGRFRVADLRWIDANRNLMDRDAAQPLV